MPGYPLVERTRGGDSHLFETSFEPLSGDDPVLYFFHLPSNFVPRRDRTPLEQPDAPFVSRSGGRLAIIYPAVGRTKIRFWIERLAEGASLDAYDLEKLLRPDQSKATKVGFEFNFGFFKIKFGDAKRRLTHLGENYTRYIRIHYWSPNSLSSGQLRADWAALQADNRLLALIH